MRSFTAILLLLLFMTRATGAERMVSGGDVDALIAAIDSANSNPDVDKIDVFGVFRFDHKTRLPPIRSFIAISGALAGNARFVGDFNNRGQFINVADKATLHIQNIRFSSFSLTNPLFEPGPFGPWMENLGELKIEDSSFDSIAGGNSGGVGLPPIPLHGHAAISNRGRLVLNRVTFLDVGVNDLSGGLLINEGTAEFSNVQIAHFDFRPQGATILNRGGSMRLINTTISAGQRFLNQSLVGIKMLGSSAKISMGNSIVTAFSVNCNGRVTSLGHNLSSDDSCRLDQGSDISGVAAALIPLGFKREDTTHIPALEPSASSPAVDSADPALCPAEDVFGHQRGYDGNQDGVAGCDRGAVELYPRLITEGGANGLFFDPDSDGHFVSVLENDNNTLVIWSTFDQSGALSWVYGIGQLVSGRSLIADAYINRDGALSDGGPPTGANAVHWGTLELELDDCNSGRFFYTSDDQAFGHGQFPVKRLARVKQLGCRDR